MLRMALVLGLVTFACSNPPVSPKLSKAGAESSLNQDGDSKAKPDGSENIPTTEGTLGSSTAKDRVEDSALEEANVADSASLALSGKQFQQWANETLDQIEKDFRIGGKHLYYEDSSHKDVAFVWEAGVQLGALIAAGKIAEAEAFAEDIQTHYWCNKNNVWGLNAVADSCGDRYYDDNAWVAKDLLELYLINHNATYLDRAKQITAFSLSAENPAPAGGIRWHEGDADGQCLCSTAPTMVSALMLYDITKTQTYLDAGKRLYQWVKANRFGAGPGYRGYENAVILQAALLLKKFTGDDTYLKDAQHIGHTMETHYINPMTHALRETAQWGGHDMTNAYADLYAVDGNVNWLNIVTGYLSFLHDKLKTPNGRYPEDWRQAEGKESPGLLYQAAAARAYARHGETVGGSLKLPDPSTIFGDCNFQGSSQKGLPVGRFTRSDMQFLGFEDKEISSLKVQPGFKVTLYDQDNFKGESLVKTADTPCLVQEAGNWNDRTLSMVVEPVEPAALVSVDCNYTGYTLALTPGKYTLARLKARGISNHDISSIKLAPGYGIVAYKADDFAGEKLTLDASSACLDDSWNKKITSIRVVKYK